MFVQRSFAFKIEATLVGSSKNGFGDTYGYKSGIGKSGYSVKMTQKNLIRQDVEAQEQSKYMYID